MTSFMGEPFDGAVGVDSSILRAVAVDMDFPFPKADLVTVFVACARGLPSEFWGYSQVVERGNRNGARMAIPSKLHTRSIYPWIHAYLINSLTNYAA
jgi:hypothetical protein